MSKQQFPQVYEVHPFIYWQEFSFRDKHLELEKNSMLDGPLLTAAKKSETKSGFLYQSYVLLTHPLV